MNYRITTKRGSTMIIDTSNETTRAHLFPLVSIEVTANIANLADIATVVFSGFQMNNPIMLENHFKKGDAIKLEFGYDGNLVNEFEGYIDRCFYDNNDFRLECMDALYLFKNSVKDIELKNVSLRDLLVYICKEIDKSYLVVTEIEMTYEKFVIHEATAYDVLKNIAESTKFNIYFNTSKKELHVHPAFIEKTGEVIYKMQENVEATSLEFVSKEDKKLKVKIEGTTLSGKSYKLEKGETDTDSDIVELKLNSVSQEQAQKVLDQTYESRNRDRYKGSIDTWLIPFCSPGHTAKIIDDDFKNRTSKHYVNSVTTSFSESGGKRTIELGFKVG